MPSCTALSSFGAPCMDQCKTDLSCRCFEGLPLQCHGLAGFRPPSWCGASWSLLWSPCTWPGSSGHTRVWISPYFIVCFAVCLCWALEAQTFVGLKGQKCEEQTSLPIPWSSQDSTTGWGTAHYTPPTSLAHRQVGKGLLCTPPCCWGGCRGQETETQSSLTVRVCSSLLTHKSCLNKLGGLAWASLRWFISTQTG